MSQIKDSQDRKLRILVAENDRSFRFHARQVLKTQGLEVSEAENGRQALEAFQYS